MKKFIYLLLLSFALLLAMPPGPVKAITFEKQKIACIDQSQIAPAALVQEQETGGVAVEQQIPGEEVVQANTVKDFLLKNWFEVLTGLILFAHVIVRLTPTTKDDSVLSWIENLINAVVPSYKKGGGTFKAPSN